MARKQHTAEQIISRQRAVSPSPARGEGTGTPGGGRS